MKKLFFLLLTIVLTTIGCNETSENPVQREETPDAKQELLDKIASLEASVMDENGRIDRSEGNQLLRAYINFTNQYHEDDMRCDYTVQAAKLAQGLERYTQAIELYTNVYQGCLTHKLNVESLFMIAVIHHNFLNDRETAKKHYEDFIEHHADHPLAADAQSMLDMLYMTDDQIIEKFKKNNADSDLPS